MSASNLHQHWDVIRTYWNKERPETTWNELKPSKTIQKIADKMKPLISGHPEWRALPNNWQTLEDRTKLLHIPYKKTSK